MPRLSSQALYALRNHIDIDRLMTQVLQIPTQEINGMGRFQCPLCARFHTATHPNTNLARCFDCQKNFNTIELVMAVRHIRFLEAVAVLQRYQKILANRSHPPSIPTRFTQHASFAKSQPVAGTRSCLRRNSQNYSTATYEYKGCLAPERNKANPQ